MLERYEMWFSNLVVWLQEMALWCSFSQKNEVGNLGLMTKSLVSKKKNVVLEQKRCNTTGTEGHTLKCVVASYVK